jgi:hypothetical protein
MAEAFDHLFKQMRFYIIRDAIYIVGGSIVLLALLERLDWLQHLSALTFGPSVLFASVAYVVGTIISHAASICHLVETNVYVEQQPHRLAQWIYYRHFRRPWDLPATTPDLRRRYETTHQWIYDKGSEWEVSNLERIIALKHVGNVVSPCCLVASMVLAPVNNSGSLPISLSALSLGVLALPLGWAMAGRQTKFVLDRSERAISSSASSQVVCTHSLSET